MTLEVEEFTRRGYNYRIHMTLEEGVNKKKTTQRIQELEKVEPISTTKVVEIKM